MIAAMQTVKKSLLRRLLPLLVFALLVLVLAIGLTLNPRLVPSPLIGKPAPAFDLPLLNGEGRFTQEDFKGQITLLNVWASWCYVCRIEHQAITQLAKQGVRVVGLNYKDDPADANAWLQQLGNPYEKIIADADGRVGIEWGVYGAPETFVIDQNGIIREKCIGEVNRDFIENRLQPLMQLLQTQAGTSKT